MADISTISDLFKIWMRIVNKLDILESIPADYGVGVLLHPSEIHLIQAIGDNAGSNLSTIATILGITRGAASQKVTQLAHRGFIRKTRRESNEKEVFLDLTDAGRRAYEHHEEKHSDVYRRIIEHCGAVTQPEIDGIRRFLSSMELVFDERIIEKMKGKKLTAQDNS